MQTTLDELLAISEDEIASWPEKDQQWYTAEVQRLIELRSPADFAVANSRGAWVPYRHLQATSDAIVGMLVDDDCDLLIIDQPIRHGKTELCSRWTPAWMLARFPQWRVLLSSYEADFAATHGRKVRDIIDEVGEKYGIALHPGSKAAARWELSNGQGGMGTAGCGGPIIGKGGNLLIVDDPTKNFDEANSMVYREKLWDWWQNVWLGRREPGAKALVIMSRWHQDDLIGRLLKHDSGMRIKRLRMPVIAEEDDSLGREIGEALCPERYDEVALASIRKDVGPTAWASQYQQRPQARGGGLLRPSEQLNTFVKEQIAGDIFYQCGDVLIDDAECARFATMDVAYTKTRQSDYTVMGTFAVAPADPSFLLILNIERRRTTHAEHADLVMSTWRDWAPSWVGIEKQMATLSMFDQAQRDGVVVRWLKPDKHKVARAETLGALMAAGRVWVPAGAEWLTDFVDELAAFPVGKHDDQVDVAAYAAIELTKRHVNPRRARQRAKSPDELMWDRVQSMKKGSRLHETLGRWPS